MSYAQRSFKSGAALLWAALVACLLLTPGSMLETSWLDLPFRVDGIVHALLFLVLALLLQRALGPSSIYSTTLTLAGATGYAVLLEVLQIAVPGRSFELFDIVAGVFGIVVALASGAAVHRFRHRDASGSSG